MLLNQSLSDNLIVFKSSFTEINEKIAKQRVQRTFVFLNNDIFLELVKNKQYLHISLNFAKPFIEVTDFIPKNVKSDTSLFAQNIKKYFQGARINNIEQLNKDRIIKFKIFKVFENYDTFEGNVIIELFSNHPNLIIVNLDDQIVFAKHYTNLQSIRLVLNNMNYELPNKKFDFDPKTYIIEPYIKDYNFNLNHSILKDQNLDIFKLLKNKTKHLNKKIESLKLQKEEYSNYEIYKDAADYIYCNLEEKLDQVEIDGKIIKLDPSIDNINNANKLYKKYKKSKKGQQLIDEFISKTSAELDYFLNFDVQLTNYTYEDLLEIRYQLIKDGYLKSKQNTKLTKPSFAPYYIEYNGYKIGYGKNMNQNDILTFNLASKDYYYLHIKDYHGAHIVIFDNNPPAEIIKIAAELALFLSNKDAGNVQLADVKDVKKTSNKGKVLINKYELITINSYDNKFISSLILTSKRF